jgi:putative nucleotidyltransferase with HDIG domain
MPKTQKNSTSVKDTVKAKIKDTTVIKALTKSLQKIRLPGFINSPFVILFCTIAATLVLFPYTSVVHSFNLPKEGNVSKETIIAPLTFDIIKSPEELKRDREEAEGQVLYVFNRDKEKHKQIRKKLKNLRSEIARLTDAKSKDSLKTGIKTKLKSELSDNTIKVLIKRPYLLDDVIFQAEQILKTGVLSDLLVPNEEKRVEMKEKYNKEFKNYHIYPKTYIVVIQDSVDVPVKHSELPVKEVALETIMYTLKVERMFDQEALTSVFELLDTYLLPNVRYNGEETQRRIQMAHKAVLTTKGKVLKDTEIVREHQEVTKEIVEKLKSLYKASESKEHGQEKRRVLRNNIGKVIFVIIFLILIFYYILVFYNEKLKKTKHLIALACIVVLQILIIRFSLIIIYRLFESGSEIIPELLIPTAIASILVAILFDFKLSLVITLFISIYFGIALSFNHSLFIGSLMGGFIGGFYTYKIRYRWDFFKAMAPIITAYIAYILIWNLMNYYSFDFLALVQNIGLSIINCIVTILLSMMSVAMFEYFFDITTNMTLIELSDMNNPLLKRLSIEAAGTYNHSVLVANLAESAAEKVHANPLLARIASYYHDVGKLAKPNYFVENQKLDKNIHDKLTPNMSALIISSHVKEGLDLAKKYKLPSVIQDSILQHHGTSTVSFFYEKALEQDQHNQVREKDYCYPGPRPLTRENAIIMLADSVEAASRSLSDSSLKMLRALVKKIIHDKFASSQLDECDLTFHDLDQIIEGFMPVLQGIFHTRIEYPNKK